MEQSDLILDVTQLKSPPRISLCVFKLGGDDKNVFINFASSQFGAYTLANVKDTLYKVRVTTTDLPQRSVVTFCVTNGVFLLIRIAAPLVLVIGMM